MGTHNLKEGSYLTLWVLKMVVEFPPYSMILVLSVILMHNNTSIGRMKSS